MRNGIVAGLVGYLLVILPGVLALPSTLPLGIPVAIVFLYAMYRSALTTEAKDSFREEVRAPFRTLVIASLIYHFAPSIYPGLDRSVDQSYILLFMMSLIVGFLASVIITFVVRKIK